MMLTAAHGAIYGCRAIAVFTTQDLRREPVPEAERPQRIPPADAITIAVTLTHQGLMAALMALYYYAWFYGQKDGFEDCTDTTTITRTGACKRMDDGEVDGFWNAFIAMILFLVFMVNLKM